MAVSIESGGRAPLALPRRLRIASWHARKLGDQKVSLGSVATSSQLSASHPRAAFAVGRQSASSPHPSPQGISSGRRPSRLLYGGNVHPNRGALPRVAALVCPAFHVTASYQGLRRPIAAAAPAPSSSGLSRGSATPWGSHGHCRCSAGSEKPNPPDEADPRDKPEDDGRPCCTWRRRPAPAVRIVFGGITTPWSPARP
jgi:hypothetical protein